MTSIQHCIEGCLNHRANSGLRVTFKLTQPEGATPEALIGTSRGAAFGDLEGDGDVDIVVVDLDARVKVLENIAPREGAAASWVGFQAVSGKKSAIVHGATVSIARGDAGKRQYRQANPCYSYLSSNDPRTHFGLGGESTAKDVQVRWPDGSVERFGDRPAGQYYSLKKGEGEKQ